MYGRRIAAVSGLLDGDFLDKVKALGSELGCDMQQGVAERVGLLYGD